MAQYFQGLLVLLLLTITTTKLGGGGGSGSAFAFSPVMVWLLSSYVRRGFPGPPRCPSIIKPQHHHQQQQHSCFFQLKTTTTRRSTIRSNSEDDETKTNKKNQISANSIYFDIAIAGEEIGRLRLELANPSPLPLHAENIIQLAKGSRRGIDPKAHYVGCEFDYSPLYIEEPGAGAGGRYRWSHQLKGRGRNAVGSRPDQTLVDVENQRQCTHACYGGQYYGIQYNQDDDSSSSSTMMNDDPCVLLTVPILGPGHGTSKFSLVRVGESPKEWGERLLLNSGVLGKLAVESLPVLQTMARQRRGPPTVVAAGVLMGDNDDHDNDDTEEKEKEKAK